METPFDRATKAVPLLRTMPVEEMTGEENLKRLVARLKSENLLNIWQVPEEFGKWLSICQQRMVKSYLEIGTMFAGTLICTSEILRRTTGLNKIVGIDINVKPIVWAYQNIAPWVEVHQVGSMSPAFRKLISGQRFDACFVDGDHSKKACLSDTLMCLGISHLVGVHDITSVASVKDVWHENFDKTGTKICFGDLGIGVIETK